MSYAFATFCPWRVQMTRTIQRRTRKIGALAVAAMTLAVARPWTLFAQAPEPAKVKFAQINAADMKEWLTVLASDGFQGRRFLTEGYGMAAAYVAERLKEFGVKPFGDSGSYFQIVPYRSYRVS